MEDLIMKFDQVIFPLPLLPNSLQGVVSLTTQKNIQTAKYLS